MKSNRIIAWAVMILGIAISSSAFAQAQPVPPFSIQILPPNPTAADNVIARIGVDRCYVLTSTTTNQGGNTIRLDLAPAACPGTPFGPTDVALGQLPYGVYTLSVFYSGVAAGSTTFSVTAFPITGAPTLSHIALALLLIAVAAIGLKGLRSRNMLSAWLVVLTGIGGWSISGSPKADSAIDRVPVAAVPVPKRIKIRFNRALLNPSANDLRLATESPSGSTLSTILGRPSRISRVIGREPTEFENLLLAKFPETPEARITQYFVLDFDTDQATQSAKTALNGDSRFAHVSDDVFATPSAIITDAYAGIPPLTLPPPQYQWGLHALNFPQAFDKYTGSVRVGIVDTGIANTIASPQATHPDLQANFRLHLSRNFNNLSPGSTVQNDLVDEFYIGTAPSFPYRGHGTHVSGIIAAAWDGAGTVGGCPNCSLIVGKYSLAASSILASAINHLVDVGAQVINLSFETDKLCGNSSVADLCDALGKAKAADVAVVASAGNGQSPLLTAPASESSVIAVAGIQPDLSFWAGNTSITQIAFTPSATGPVGPFTPFATGPFGSNFNSRIHLVGPATSVLSTLPQNTVYLVTTAPDPNLSALDEQFVFEGQTIAPGPANSPGWGTFSGTSMAAPYISALVGLVRTVDPLKPASGIENLIANSASQSVSYQGLTFKIPNAAAAVDATLGSASAINRHTPMFGFWSFGRKSHFYTTSPQEANAALRGTILPQSNFGPEAFVSAGNQLLSYSQFPPVLCGLSPCFQPGPTPRALFEVWSGPRSPFAAQQTMRVLWRMSNTVPGTRSTKFVYAADLFGSNTERSYFGGQGFTLDALDGYVMAVVPGEAQPPGTVRLCRKKYDISGGTAAQANDYILFIDDKLGGPVCSQVNDCTLPNGTCGDTSSYIPDPNLPTHIGWVVPSYNATDDDNDGMPYSVEIAEGRSPSAKDNDIFGVSRLFVYQQTKDMLHRLAQDFEVTNMASDLDFNVITRQAAIQNFINNPDHFNVYAPLVRLYRGHLNRRPDYDGLEFYANQFRQNTPLETIVTQFANSSEFAALMATMNDSQFVANYLYNVVLGRNPDPGGQAFWLAQLANGMSRSDCLFEVEKSTEGKLAAANYVSVDLLYQAMLRRTADLGGLNYWVGVLSASPPTPYATIVNVFFLSVEYRNRFL